MGRDTLTFEQIEDELYIVLENETIGRIVDQGSDNFLISWENSNEPKIPIHSLDSAKRYVTKYYKERISE